MFPVSTPSAKVGESGPVKGYKAAFVEFMVRSGVLNFGEFVTKSGRKTPFFINTGRFDTGARLARLGQFYAQALHERLGDGFDFLYGPAYKGIPLVTATAIALSWPIGREVPFAFNRKEAKNHGEGGLIVGHQPRDGERVVIVEDVATSGASVRESAELLTGIADVRLAGLIVSVDRQERGRAEQSALAELGADLNIDAFPIVTLDEIVQCLRERPIDGQLILNDPLLERIEAYRAKYGA